MTATANLGLPFIEAAQAQKHVTHNEALRMLDALVMLAVLDRDLSAPPVDPEEGDRYIVKAPGSGGFAGKDDQIAHYSDGGWTFYPARAGWICYAVDEEALLAWDGTAWSAALDVLGGVSELQDLARLGVGTEADAVNPFAAKLNNALWTARTAAEGGDGGLRCKMNKEGAGNTLSLLMQTGYSGRAEIGLTGDDDLHVKVSPDGSSWIDALLVERASGAAKINAGLFLTGDISPATITGDQNDYNPAGLAGASVLRLASDASRNLTGLSGGGEGRVVALVNAGSQSIVLKNEHAGSGAGNRFAFSADVTLLAKQAAALWFDAADSRWKLLAGPQAAAGGGGGRALLTAGRTYYVRADGSDANDGLSNSSGGAFLTIQKAVDVAAALDLSIYDVTIQIGNGTYAGAVVLKSTVGAGRITIKGDAATPSNVVISTAAATAISADGLRGLYKIEGVKIATTTSGHGIYLVKSGLELGAVEFGAVANGYNQIYLEAQSYLKCLANYTISGGTSGTHWAIRSGSYLDCRSLTITLSGTPGFGIFCYGDLISNLLVASLTFSGAATGQRYNISGNTVVFTGGGGANYFPGNSAGASATGAQYI